jgi:hypothetical protein
MQMTQINVMNVQQVIKHQGKPKVAKVATYAFLVSISSKKVKTFATNVNQGCMIIMTMQD